MPPPPIHMPPGDPGVIPPMALRALSSASLRHGCRRLCTPASPQKPPRAACFGAGVAGGMLGGLVGLGGGAVMVPAMTTYAKMTQHAAVGTSSAAVAAVGFSGMLSYGSSGAVDLVAAAAVAFTAMGGARVGARLTSRFDAVQLQRTFAVFQLCLAPMVPLKGYVVRQSKQEAATAGTETGNANAAGDTPAVDGAAAPTPAVVDSSTAWKVAKLAGVGCFAGVSSGMFGIGGGVIVTPALCLLTDLPYVAVLGTTLASMVPPSLVSMATHHKLGNVSTAAVLPLCLGSAAGAFCGGQLAQHLPSEEPLQLLFAVVIAAMGGHKLRALRGK